jgi:vancomycin resistance protein YoaR
MKRVLLGSGIGIAAGAAFLCVFAAKYQPTVRPRTFAGPISVGGLTSEAAGKKLRVWWEFERTQKFELVAKGVEGKLPKLTPDQLGVTLDDAATVATLPMETFVGNAEDVVSTHAYDPSHLPIVYRAVGKSYAELAQRIKLLVGEPHPATVDFVGGQVVRTAEIAPTELDAQAMPQAAIAAIQNSDVVQLPMKVGDKQISDDALNSITDEISEFSTRFPAYNRPRCSNIRLAAGRLSGHILMPGERMSFNDVVGRRTLRTGFKLAGIYKNGKHDTGIGGGICQVSTTMYNASLLGNLKIRRRSNHSLPVAYVPLGRDATVDYGNLDLVVENPYTTPVAVVSEYEPGRLTFRILGKKDPSLEVKITTKPGRTDRRATETQYVNDPKLAKGLQKVVDPGSVFRSVLTYRKLYRDGKLVEIQPLGPSYYGGKEKIVAVGTGAPVGRPALPAATAVPVTNPVGG